MKTIWTFLLYLLSWTHCPPGVFAGEVESCAVQQPQQQQRYQQQQQNQFSSSSQITTTTTIKPTNSHHHQHPNPPNETLICQIRTLHSSLNLLTLTPSPPDTILKLKLICNDVLFFESTLSSPQLSPFKNLQELEIRNCKLKRIENLENLPQLKKLIITTGNSDWPQRVLSINPLALRNSTAHLETLELGFNNMESLPPGFLCSLGSLRTLNLTHNQLSNINDLGLAACSQAEFQVPEVPQDRQRPVSENSEDRQLRVPEDRQVKIPGDRDRPARFPEDRPEDRQAPAGEIDNSGKIKAGFGELDVVEFGEFGGKAGMSDGFEISAAPAGESVGEVSGVFGVVGVKSLDLSFNYLESLDKLEDEKSNNKAGGGGGGWEYLSQVEILRLDHNRLTELGLEFNGNSSTSTRTFPSTNLGQLRVLNLSSNHLISLGPHLLTASHHLRELHLRNNSLAALPPGLFQTLEHLRVLDLSQNFLAGSWISQGIFSKLFRLVHLNLSQNQLTHLGPGTFSSLFTLQSLDLSFNLISSLGNVESSFGESSFGAPGESFGASGESLGVPGESFSFGASPFSALSQLKSLNLAHNRLKIINANTFNGLISLSKLSLDYNDIHNIDLRAFENSTEIQDLTLVRNSLEAFPAALKKLHKLKALDLGENKISKLDNNTFQGLDQLLGLRLAGNLIGSVPSGFCHFTPKLRALNLGSNKIGNILPPSFGGCPDLRALYLDSNLLENLEPGLQNELGNLLWLNISGNGLKSLDYTTLPRNLQWLDASRNALSKLREYDFQRGHQRNRLLLPNLRVLDLSFNNLMQLDSGSIPGSLEVIKLGYNQIERVGSDTFGRAGRLRRVELNSNKLKKLELKALGLPLVLPQAASTSSELNNNNNPSFNKNRPAIVEFFLAGNPFTCDCDMEWLTRVNSLSSFGSLTIVDMDEIQCEISFSRSSSGNQRFNENASENEQTASENQQTESGNQQPPSENQRANQFASENQHSTEITSENHRSHRSSPEIRRLAEMQPQDFLCRYTNHCFYLCHCCEFDYCDCQMTCPEGCDCFHDDTWSANVVNCAGRNVSSIPAALPMDSTQVYLDGNNIHALKSHGFIGRKNLRILFLNGSNIERISNKSFNGLHSLQVLHLESNKLTSLIGFEFEGLTRLKELHLNDNYIKSISNDTFLNLKSLETLNLAGNLLLTFKVWQLNLNRNLGSVFLAGNPFECGHCEFLGLLYKWTRENSRKIQDLEEIHCKWNRTGLVGPTINNYNLTCQIGSGGFSEFINYLPVTSLYILGAAGVFFLLSLILLWVCAERIKFFIFKSFRLRIPSGRRNNIRTGSLNSNKGKNNEDDDPDQKCSYSFDATLIFSRQDIDFSRRIADNLQVKGYRTLLLPDMRRPNLNDSNYCCSPSSSSIIVILSRNFLQDFNSDPDFRQNFFNLLLFFNTNNRDTNITNKNNINNGFHGNRNNGDNLSSNLSTSLTTNCVIIVKDKLPKERIQQDFFNSFQLMNSNKRIRKLLEKQTVVFESTKNFWDKLLFYLGDPPSASLVLAGNYIGSNNYCHSHQTSDTGYGTSPSSSLVYKTNFHSALESGSLTSINQPAAPAAAGMTLMNQLPGSFNNLVGNSGVLNPPAVLNNLSNNFSNSHRNNQFNYVNQPGNFNPGNNPGILSCVPINSSSVLNSGNNPRILTSRNPSAGALTSDNNSGSLNSVNNSRRKMLLFDNPEINRINWPYSSEIDNKVIPQPPPHFQEILRNSQFNLNNPYNNGSMYLLTHQHQQPGHPGSSFSGRVSRADSGSQASPPSNATDTTNIPDLEGQEEDDPTVMSDSYSSHYYYRPGSGSDEVNQQKQLVPSTKAEGCDEEDEDDDDSHYYFSLEPASPAKNNSIKNKINGGECIPPPLHVNSLKNNNNNHHHRHNNQVASPLRGRIQMQTFMV